MATKDFFRDIKTKENLFFLFKSYMISQGKEEMIMFCDEYLNLRESQKATIIEITEIHAKFVAGNTSYSLDLEPSMRQQLASLLQQAPKITMFQPVYEKISIDLDDIYFSKLRQTELFQTYTTGIQKRRGSASITNLFRRKKETKAPSKFELVVEENDKTEGSVDQSSYSASGESDHSNFQDEIVGQIRGVTYLVDKLQCLFELYLNDLSKKDVTWHRVSKIRTVLSILLQMFSEMNTGFSTQHPYISEYTDGILGEPFKLLISTTIRELKHFCRTILWAIYESYHFLIFVNKLLTTVIQAVETGSIPLDYPNFPAEAINTYFPISPFWQPTEHPNGSPAFNFGSLDLRMKKLLRTNYVDCQVTLYRHNLIIKSGPELLHDIKLSSIVSLNEHEYLDYKGYTFNLEYLSSSGNSKELAFGTHYHQYGRSWLLAIHTLEPLLTTETLKNLDSNKINHQTMARGLSKGGNNFNTLAWVLSHEKARLLLKDFMNKKHCVEHYLFLDEVRQYKQILTTTERTPKVTQIFNTFIKHGSSSEINIDQNEKDRIGREYSKAEPWLFDEAETTIILLIEADIWPKFRSDPLFQSLVVSEKISSGQDVK